MPICLVEWHFEIKRKGQSIDKSNQLVDHLVMRLAGWILKVQKVMEVPLDRVIELKDRDTKEAFKKIVKGFKNLDNNHCQVRLALQRGPFGQV